MAMIPHFADVEAVFECYGARSVDSGEGTVRFTIIGDDIILVGPPHNIVPLDREMVLVERPGLDGVAILSVEEFGRRFPTA